jgi:hypothetical protein
MCEFAVRFIDLGRTKFTTGVFMETYYSVGQFSRGEV